jgi:carboxylate-amine ligase
MPTLKENMALTALIYLLVVKFSQEFETNGKLSRMERWILEENKWRAARYGIQGEFINGKKGKTHKIRDTLLELYDELNGFSGKQSLKEAQNYLSVIPEILSKGPSYQRQRQWARQRPGDYKYIIDNLLQETRQNTFIE